ncbi:hypothetical protein ACF0H5_006583 [Mactra antiquata]
MALLPPQHNKNMVEITPTTTTNDNSKKKTSLLYQKIQDLLLLMHKYNTSGKDELYRLTSKTSDQKSYIEIFRSHQWSRIYNNAKEEYNLKKQINNVNYYNWFMEFNPETYKNTTKYLSWEETHRFFYYWCMEQRINPNQFATDMHKVLKQLDNKKNTLYLQGASNAGKTYLMKMLIPVDTIAGYHTTSKEFPFGDAVYQPVILINELTIESSAKAELYKNVLGDAGAFESIMMVEQPTQKTNTQQTTDVESSPISTTNTSTQTLPMQIDQPTKTDEETQTEPLLPTYTTCYGCSIDHPSQVQHMDIGGCLYNPPVYVTSDKYDNVSPPTNNVPPPQYEDISPPDNYPDADSTTNKMDYIQMLDLSDITPTTPEDTTHSTPKMPTPNQILTAQIYDPTKTLRKSPRLNLYRHYLDLKEAGELDDDEVTPSPAKKFKITDDSNDYIVISSDPEEELCTRL